MLSLNCSADFSDSLWYEFDSAMNSEWQLNVTTGCYQIQSIPSSLSGYVDLRDEILKAKQEQQASLLAYESDLTDFTAYIDNLLSTAPRRNGLPEAVDAASNSTNVKKSGTQIAFITEYSEDAFRANALAQGIAYPSQDIALVRNNYQYSIAPVSHEILHLALQEDDYSPECYLYKLHEMQFRYILTPSGYPIIQKFGCGQMPD